MRVLLVSHTGRVSGGERSLLDLVSALPDSVQVVAATPTGTLSERLLLAGVPTLPLPEVDAGFRLSLTQTGRGLLSMSRAATAVAGYARRLRSDVVHANSVRAGLIGVAAAQMGAPRPVVHVRDRVPDSSAGRLVRRVINARGGALVANSTATLNDWGATTLPAVVALGPVQLGRFDPALHDRDVERRSLGLGKGDAPVLTIVGQITPWKGQDLAIRTAARLRARWPGATLLVVGDVEFDGPGTGYDNPSYARSLRRLTEELGAGDVIHFLGRREDLPGILSATDVLLVPSWHEPMGRTVLEGLAMGVLLACTDRGGPAEMLTDPRHGVLLPPHEVDRWVTDVDRLLSAGDRYDPGRIKSARDQAARYSAHRHAETVLRAWTAVAPDGRASA
jgi:glycosyltransferase involved in cell wall biosynthesis